MYVHTVKFSIFPSKLLQTLSVHLFQTQFDSLNTYQTHFQYWYLKKNRGGYKNSYNVNDVLNIPIPVSNTNLTVYACRKTRLMGSLRAL
jgi:hypothetical protein